jgi:hypothetical protein
MSGDWLLFAKVIGGIVAALWLVVLLIEAWETRRLRKLMPTTTAEERVERARLQAATFAGPAAKGFARHDNIEPVGDELARHVFVNMKRIEDPRPLRVVGTMTRALKVEIR